MNWYLQVLKKYAVFSGRARRREYWMFILIHIIISIVIGLLDAMLFSGFGNSDVSFLGSIYTLAVFLPSLGVLVRRLHDIGKSGWMVLVGIIPIIGWIWLLVLAAREGDIGDNEYGPDPKEEMW